MKSMKTAGKEVTSMKEAVVRPGKRGLKHSARSKKPLDSCEFELEEADNLIAPIFKKRLLFWDRCI